jgi:sugar lactone lactonase YvrE
MKRENATSPKAREYRALALLLTAFLLNGLSGQDADAQTGADELADTELYVSVELTPPGEATTGLDGLASDREGNLYAANYRGPGTICQMTPDGEIRDFASLPDGCPASGLQFHANGLLLVADPRYHRILQVDPRTRQVREYARGLASLMMASPAHLAVAANGFTYVPDPDWEGQTGQLWGIDETGASFRMTGGLGTVNGIALSPDDRTLYLSESMQGQVWAYDLSPEGELGNRRLLVSFAEDQPAAMTVDIAGDLYIACQGRGTVVKVSPEGEVLQEIALAGEQPTGIALGGADGYTCFVALADRGNIEGFRVERPGRDWTSLPLPGETPTPVLPARWGQVKELQR